MFVKEVNNPKSYVISKFVVNQGLCLSINNDIFYYFMQIVRQCFGFVYFDRFQ